MIVNDNIVFKVRVYCLTYNHASYIVDAMNGFCMQKTTFPYVCTIFDDASTDGESEVIKEYLHEHFEMDDKSIAKHEDNNDYEMIFARHKTNVNCFFAVLLLKYNHYSINKSKDAYVPKWIENAEYVALCEGDDFWTDSSKLQMQTDFLKCHPDYSMCFHRVDVKVEMNRIEKPENVFAFLKEGEYTRDDQLRIRRIVPTCSILIRKNVLDRTPSHPKFTIGDVVVVATALTYGRMWCIGKNMGCYRLVENGWTSMSDLKMSESMFSHNQGMIESFEWYQTPGGYDIFKFWSFSFLKLLRDIGDNEKFEKVANEYKSFMGINNLNEFWKFYYTRKVRKLLRTVFGNKITQIGKLLFDK